MASSTLTDGWHHVAVARDSAALKLYVDARLVAEYSLADYITLIPAWRFPDSITRLGSDPDGKLPFAGLIDEVALFQRALSAGDLAKVMAATTLNGSKPRS